MYTILASCTVKPQTCLGPVESVDLELELSGLHLRGEKKIQRRFPYKYSRALFIRILI